MTIKQEIAELNAQAARIRALREELTEELEEPEGPSCVVCGGPCEYLGSLAHRDWWRCRECGWEDSPAREER